MIDLASILPVILPKAIAWAEARSMEIAANGIALPAQGLEIARMVGVTRPESIRVQLVPSLPLPEDPQLRTAALQTGLLGPGMVGLTLGHGIYVCTGHDSWQLLAHEFRHVHQYESLGSIANFLPVYLAQIAQFGYYDSPFEVDARAHQGAASA